MSVDTKAALARAEEAEALAKVAHLDYSFEDSLREGVPALAADARALVAEVERLTRERVIALDDHGELSATTVAAETERDEALARVAALEAGIREEIPAYRYRALGLPFVEVQR